MQLTVSPKALASAHAALRNIPDRKSPVPVRGMYHLAAGGGRMQITATDCDIEATLTIDAGGDVESVAVAPHLIDTAGRLPAEEATIALDTRQAIVTAGRARFSAGILPGSDFPRMAPEFDCNVAVEAGALVNLFEAVRDAASADEVRYNLLGVHLETDAERLHAVATDGHRMHITSVPAPRGLDIPDGILVPSKTVSEIVRLAGKVDGGTLDLEIGKTAIAAATSNERLVSILIDGKFPDWRRVLPKPTGVTAMVDLAEMVATLDRVLKAQAADTAGSKVEHGTGVKLSEDGEYMVISAVKMTGGEAVDAVAAEFQGAWGSRGVSGKYLLATLAAMRERGGDTVTIDSDQAATPMRIEAPADEDFIGICMPMRV